MGICKTRLRAGTAAMLMAAALAGASPGMAEQEPQASASVTATATPAEVKVTVPTVTTEGSNVDEATIRRILSGDIEDIGTLAGLDATSISVPTVTLEIDVPATADSAASHQTVVYHDIVLSNVTDGVAASVVIGGADATGKDVNLKFQKLSAEDVDIGAILNFYGLTKTASDTSLRTVYRNFRIEGGSLEGDEVNCTVGAIGVAEFKARPLKTPLADFMALANETKGDKSPSPETTAKIVSFIADMTSAFETSPISFDGLQCSGKDEEGKQVAFGIGKSQIGSYAGGRYPEVSVNAISIKSEEANIGVDKLTLKPIDYSGPIAVLAAAQEPLDDAWFEAHARELIPAFGGLSFSGATIDAVDEEAPGQRIKATIGNFDLTMADYINGAPTKLSSAAHEVVIDLPKEGTDDFSKQLLALGMTQLELGYDFAAGWDKATQTIHVDKFGLNGTNLGSIALAAVVGNATEALFGTDTEAAATAGQALTLKQIKLDATDAGIADLIFKQMASEQGATPEAMRTAISGMAQGTVLAFLGGTPDAMKLAGAIGTFLNGGNTFSATITAKDEAGLGMADFEALEADPTTLGAKISIDASAQ